MMAWVDGRFIASGEAPRPGLRPAPFETMGATDGQIALWPRHQKRLAATAARLGVRCEFEPEWRAAAAELLLKNGHADGILRLLLVPADDRDHVVMTTRLRSPARSVRLIPTVVQRAATQPPADLKAYPRAFYDAVLQQAQDGGADDGIVVGKDGAVLETAVANLWLRIDGVWITPALDGRVLPGIAREILLERAAAQGGAVQVAERVVGLADLHRAEALAVSSAAYGPRPAGLVGGDPPAVEIVDSSLGSLWRGTASG